MRKNILTAAVPVVVLALGLTLAGCSSSGSTGTSNDTKSSSSASSSSSTETKSVKLAGDFKGLNGKNVAGSVTIEGTQIALAGFSSDEGPDLHIYLTNGTDEAAVSAGKQIDAVAFDQATQTFTLDGVDASQYTHVVIHCDKAKAVFGAAELS